MRICRGEEIYEASGPHESIAVDARLVRAFEESHDAREPRATFIFVLRARVDALRLTAVLLMNAVPTAIDLHSVIPLGNQSRYATDRQPVRARGGERDSRRQGRVEAILDEVRAAVARWPQCAEEAGVWPAQRKPIRSSFRLDFPRSIARRREAHS
jgi:hypothetical protein